MPERDAATATGHSFDERLSPLLARGGVAAVPSVLVRHAGRLDVTTNEVFYLLHVLERKWGREWPFLAVGEVAAAAGVDVAVARRWKASLIRKGLLTTRTRSAPSGGRLADLHDLSGLFARLEALVCEEELTRARGDLPAPTFHRGLSTIPQLSTGRPNLCVGGERTKSTGGAGRYGQGDPGADVRGAPAKSSDETEPDSKVPDAEPKPRAQITESDSTTNRAAAPRPDRYSQTDDSMMQGNEDVGASEDRGSPPGYCDAGIASLVERHGAEFGDDDVDRTNDTVHHLWWNTRLPRRSVHRALKQAYYATRAKQRDGMIRSRPMAYYLGAVVNALAAACEETGLPPPPGWKSPADAPATGRGRARGAAG